MSTVCLGMRHKYIKPWQTNARLNARRPQTTLSLRQADQPLLCSIWYMCTIFDALFEKWVPVAKVCLLTVWVLPLHLVIEERVFKVACNGHKLHHSRCRLSSHWITGVITTALEKDHPQVVLISHPVLDHSETYFLVPAFSLCRVFFPPSVSVAKSCNSTPSPSSSSPR